jgi:DAK2 domain fusion protein YloV
VLQTLDADAVRRWCTAGLDALTRHRAEIDALNVYPVPDGDTGTNLQLTMQAAAEAVAIAAPDLAATLRAMARGSLLGARGNSGVILSQMFHGIADALAAVPAAMGSDVQRGLERAAEKAYAAVAEPAEGTILTVARAAAKAAREADAQDLPAVVSAAARAATEELARTPLQLPALAAAGVVDAGGRGLVVLLDALAAVVTGHNPEHDAPPGPVVARDRTALVTAREAGSDEFGYEVQYLLEADDDAVPGLRERLAAIGDSLVVVGDERLYAVHVHVNDVGAAIEAGVEVGRPRRITVTRFADQIAAAERLQPSVTAPATEVAIVAVAPGDGLGRLFSDNGAHVVDGGPTSNPSTADLLAAIRAARAAHVVVLPNDGNVRAVAEAAAGLARVDGIGVAVIPTRSPVQGLAALAVHDPTRTAGEDVIAMTSAAGATRFAEVTTAVRDAETPAGRCRAGDVLGLIDGEAVCIGTDLFDVAHGVLDRLLSAGGELVTLVTGADAPDGLADELTSHIRGSRAGVETAVYAGGQPHYPLLLGVE